MTLGNTPEVCRRVYVHPFKDDVRDQLRALIEPDLPTTARPLRVVREDTA